MIIDNVFSLYACEWWFFNLNFSFQVSFPDIFFLSIPFFIFLFLYHILLSYSLLFILIHPYCFSSTISKIKNCPNLSFFNLNFSFFAYHFPNIFLMSISFFIFLLHICAQLPLLPLAFGNLPTVALSLSPKSQVVLKY